MFYIFIPAKLSNTTDLNVFYKNDILSILFNAYFCFSLTLKSEQMKFILFSIALVVFNGVSFGQLELGIKIGANISGLSTDLEDYKKELKPGLMAGAYARLGDKLHLQPEIYFTSKRGGIVYDTEDASGNVTTDQVIGFRTIDIPILAGYKIVNPPMMSIRLNAGPVASVVTQKVFDITRNNEKVTPSGDFEKSFRTINWGLQFGAGLDILFLSVDARYERGLNNMYKKPDSALSDDYSEIKNHLFFISLGFRILRFK
jgi:hypothetical protein